MRGTSGCCVLLVLLAGCATQGTIEPNVKASLAPTGTLRAAINYGNPVLAQRGPQGEPRGVSSELARELSRELDLPLEFVTYTGAGQVTDAATRNAWDIAFVAIDPKRAQDIDFTGPYVLIEGTYLVPANSRLRAIADFDADGIRIGVAAKSAYDLYLSRTLKRAQIVRTANSAAGIDLLLKGGLEAVAGVRQPLVTFAKEHPGLRVIEGRFMAIEQAMATAKGPGGVTRAGHRYVRDFVERMKASGFVARALQASSQPDAVVAPPASPAN